MSLTYRDEFAGWIRSFRIDGLQQTQQEMSKWLGVHAVTIGRWETSNARPHPTTLAALRRKAEEVNFPLPPPDKDRRIGPRP